MKRKQWLLVLLTCLAMLSLIAGIGYSQSRGGSSSKDYPLLSKRIFTENPNDILVNFVPLRVEVKRYLAEADIVHSFYFEYLPTGTNIRSDDDTKMAGASLLKLPTIMNLYKAVEAKQVNLDQEVTLKPEWLNRNFGSLWKKGSGYKLTLRELVRYTLVDSDDTAIAAIRNTLGNKIPSNQTVLSQLDVDFPYSLDGQSYVSARDYGSVLRCLYLSCYLEKKSSQAILDQMAQSPDFNRIAQALPKDVKVAHKIGVFGSSTQSDCGIVYVPNRPYLLCVMLQASSERSDRMMQDLSRMIYGYVSQQP